MCINLKPAFSNKYEFLQKPHEHSFLIFVIFRLNVNLKNVEICNFAQVDRLTDFREIYLKISKIPRIIHFLFYLLDFAICIVCRATVVCAWADVVCVFVWPIARRLPEIPSHLQFVWNAVCINIYFVSSAIIFGCMVFVYIYPSTRRKFPNGDSF